MESTGGDTQRGKRGPFLKKDKQVNKSGKLSFGTLRAFSLRPHAELYDHLPDQASAPLHAQHCGIISLANRDPSTDRTSVERNGRKSHMQSTSPYSGTCRRGRRISASSAMLLIISVSRYHLRNPRNNVLNLHFGANQSRILLIDAPGCIPTQRIEGNRGAARASLGSKNPTRWNLKPHGLLRFA